MAKFPGYSRDFIFTNQMDDNEVVMHLGCAIGPQENPKEQFINGSAFAQEMYYWRDQGYGITCKINCPGGMVFDAFPIMDAVRECGATTENIGIAASMGAHILASGKKRRMYDYAKVMLHPIASTEPTAKEVMDVFSASIRQMLVSRTSLSEARIDAILKPGAPDTWMDAKQALKAGIIDEIIDTDFALTEESSDPYALYNVYNKLNTEMAKPEEKSLDDSLKVITDIQNKLAESTAAITAKDAEIVALKTLLQTQKDAEVLKAKNAATALVNTAIKNKQISIPEGNTTLMDQFVKMAIDTPDAFNAMLQAKPAPRPSVINHIGTKAGGTTTEGQEEETYESLANNNPTRLYEMMDTEPEKYKALVNKFQQKI
jgi:ATP-dependent protease ClpP protease subunit